MRDYWLTQDLLQAAGTGYLLIVLGVLAAVLWFARGKAMKALGAASVLALGSALPWKAYQENVKVQQQVAEYQRRQAAARAVFDERCKTAGEKIYKVIEQTEGILLPKIRQRIGRELDYMAPGAAAWRENHGKAYILDFLLFAEPSRNRYGKSIVQTRARFPGFDYVEVQDAASGTRTRYTWNPERFLKEEPSPSERPPRYAVDFEDLVDSDRLHWVAGSRIRVIDTTDQSVMAELTYFMFEPRLGSRLGHRDPWAFAVGCPNFPFVAQMHRHLADKVLRSAQKVEK